MKKILFTLSIIACFSSTINAQKTIKGNGNLGSETRKTANYDVINLLGSTTIEIIDGIEGDLTLTGDSNLLEYIETTVHNNELTVKLKSNHNYNTKKGLKVSVPVQDISKIQLTGSGEIKGKKVLTDTNLEIYLKGSGDILLHVNNKSVVANLIGSGDLEVNGTTKNLQANVKGSGDISTKELKAEVGNLHINGSGDIKAHITKQVNASVTGSGDIEVYGKPNTVIKNVSGSGSIILK